MPGAHCDHEVCPRARQHYRLEPHNGIGVETQAVIGSLPMVNAVFARPF